MNKQNKLDSLYGEKNIVDANLFDDEDVIKLEELLNIYKKSSYWFHNKENLKGIIFRVSKVEKNTRLINILLYYMCKLSYFVFVRINDFDYKILCQCMDYLLSTVSSWVRNILIFNDYGEERKYHSLFDNVDYIMNNYEFYIAIHIAKGIIKEYYEDIMNSNLKPSIKGILIKRLINKYKDYSILDYKHLNLVNDLNFKYIDLYVPQCPEYDLINKYVDFVIEIMVKYNNDITMDSIMDCIGFYIFIEMFKINKYDYKLYVTDNMFERCLRYGIQFTRALNTVYGPNWYLKI